MRVQAAEAMDERAYWAAVLPDAVTGYDAQVRPAVLSGVHLEQQARSP